MGMVFRFRGGTQCLAFVLGAQASPPTRPHPDLFAVTLTCNNIPGHVDEVKRFG